MKRPVTVEAMMLGLAPGEEPREFYGCCSGCNWYGRSHADRRDAETDVRRHRRSHW